MLKNDKLPIVRKPSGACTQCGSTERTVRTVSDTVDFRGLTLDVEGLQYTYCSSCGKKWESRENQLHNDSIIKSAYSVERDNLRKRDGLLSSDEISAIRKNFALTQREAAVIFGGGANAFNKYESGEVLQSVPMDRLLRLAAAGGLPAITFLEKVTQQIRSDFLLSNHVDNKYIAEGLKSLHLVLQDSHSSYNLVIRNTATASNVLNAIGDTTFVPAVEAKDGSPLRAFSLPMPGSMPSSNLFFTELKK